MLRERLSVYRDRVRRELTTAFTEKHTPHEVALSFAIGLFVTALPSGGLGIGLLLALAYWLAWASKAAMLAAVAVLNPLVKPLVYVASYQLGSVLLGTEQLLVLDHAGLDTAFAVVQFLLLGNLLLAVGISLLGYAAVYRLTVTYRRRYGTAVSGGRTSADPLGLGRRGR